MNIVDIAKVCHEVNKEYCKALGDNSQLSWNEAPDWQKESAINGVRLHLSANVGPEESHKNWMLEKQKAGWTYGTIKDEIKKTHPCMVPFENLPAEQKAKDYIFRAIVHALY